MPCRIHEAGCIVGCVLHVAVEQEDVAEVARLNGCKAAPDRGALAAIVWVSNHFRAGSGRNVARAVGRAVVDDDHVADMRPDAADDVADPAGLVECRNEGASRHRTAARMRSHPSRAAV